MFDSFIASAAARYNVPDAWIRAVIQTESSWNPNAFRAEPQINDASYGLMQLLYRTASGLGYSGSPDGLYDPQTNIDLGSKLLGQLRSSYGDNFERVYSAYNSGRPDLYLTSTQVAANVSRAVSNLEQYAYEAAQGITQSPGKAALVGVVAAVLLFAWAPKRKK